MKKIYILIVTAMVLVSCSDHKESTSSPSDVPLPPPSPTPDQLVTKAPDEIKLSKKDTGKTDKIIFLVKNTSEPNLDRTKAYGQENLTNPEDNEKYIAVQVWLKNISNQEIKVFEEDFKLSDQNDAEFAEKAGFTEHRKRPILFSEYPEGVTLKPNQSRSGWITFTTEKTSKAKKIIYSNVTINL